MSTSYGHAVVTFPGFPSLHVSTTEGSIVFHNYWGETHLPKRRVRFANGEVRRLSRKERSRLLTLAKRWSTGRRRGRPYRTLYETTY